MEDAVRLTEASQLVQPHVPKANRRGTILREPVSDLRGNNLTAVSNIGQSSHTIQRRSEIVRLTVQLRCSGVDTHTYLWRSDGLGPRLVAKFELGGNRRFHGGRGIGENRADGISDGLENCPSGRVDGLRDDPIDPGNYLSHCSWVLFPQRCARDKVSEQERQRSLRQLHDASLTYRLSKAPDTRDRPGQPFTRLRPG